MKKSCCLGLCSLLICNATALEWSDYEDFSEERIVSLTKTLKNPGSAKEFLTGIFADAHCLWQEEIPLFKKKFDVQDEIVRPVIWGILRESAQKVGWETPVSWKDDPLDVTLDKRRLWSSVQWLGVFADEPAKQFLLDIAADDAKDISYRNSAAQAYLYCADAQETKNFLSHHLAVDRRVPRLRNAVYASAEGTYEATTDEAKREAILAVFYVVMAQEENKDTFSYRDKKLAQRSQKYAESSQRLAMLKRISKLPPSKGRDTDNDLNAALESYKSRKTFTSVSTNLTELMARDFRKPTGKGGQ